MERGLASELSSSLMKEALEFRIINYKNLRPFGDDFPYDSIIELLNINEMVNDEVKQNSML